MNPAVQVVLDHIKAKADVNGDGKVDAADFDLVAKMIKADLDAGLVMGQSFSAAAVAHATPLGAIVCGYAAGVATVLAAIRVFGG